jgi:hypothetical protein
MWTQIHAQLKQQHPDYSNFDVLSSRQNQEKSPKNKILRTIKLDSM